MAYKTLHDLEPSYLFEFICWFFYHTLCFSQLASYLLLLSPWNHQPRHLCTAVSSLWNSLPPHPCASPPYLVFAHMSPSQKVIPDHPSQNISPHHSLSLYFDLFLSIKLTETWGVHICVCLIIFLFWEYKLQKGNLVSLLRRTCVICVELESNHKEFICFCAFAFFFTFSVLNLSSENHLHAHFPLLLSVIFYELI